MNLAELRGAASKVRAYLAELSPIRRAQLLAGMEQARRAGKLDMMQKILFDELQEFRANTSLLMNFYRLWVTPIEDFLIGASLPTKIPGRIARQVLPSIWRWIIQEGAPIEVADFESRLLADCPSQENLEGDPAHQIGLQFCQALVERLIPLLEEARNIPEKLGRLEGHVGGPRALLELEDILQIQNNRALLNELRAGLHADLDPNKSEDVAIVAGAVSRAAAGGQNLAGYAAILIRANTEPVRLPRFAVVSARTNDMRIVAASPFGRLIDVALSDVEWSVERAQQALRSPNIEEAVPAIREFHLLSRQLRASLDLERPSSDWARRLMAMRSHFSAELSRQLSELPTLLRRCVHASRSKGKSAVLPDDTDVRHVCALIKLFDATRLATDELAVNALVTRICADTIPYVDQTTSALVEDLRSLQGESRDRARAQACAMIQVQDALHGPIQAGIVRRSFEVAMGASFTDAPRIIA